VIGESQSLATQQLESDGFTVNPVTNSGPPGSTPGTVWKMSPSADTMAPQGATITIDVAAQPVVSTPSPTVSPTPTPSSSSPGPTPSSQQ
jgi:beta-lactam-binding protein with PASTA domain